MSRECYPTTLGNNVLTTATLEENQKFEGNALMNTFIAFTPVNLTTITTTTTTNTTTTTTTNHYYATLVIFCMNLLFEQYIRKFKLNLPS